MSLAWMPKGMDPAEKQAIADSYDDPHMAAAIAWETWAAQMDAEGNVTSINTGAQSITYAKGSSPFTVAMERATWHRNRATVRSVNVGEHYRYGWTHHRERDQQTYDSAPIPPTGIAQFNLPSGTVGPNP